MGLLRKLIDSTGMPAKDIVNFLEEGFSEEEIIYLGEVASKYGMKKRSVRYHVSSFINSGVTKKGDVVGLIEIREMLRSEKDYGKSPGYELIVGIYKRFGGEEGGLEGLRQFAEFVLDNEDKILRALPYPNYPEIRKIECLSAWLTYELNERDPEKTREKLEQLIESYQRTS